ncbi:MAG: LLM class flavin-dependent oxidoreductase [Chloroflexota bacterium]|nr:LLM class flavin-dependent oxidoreductase [Chloroflexota bacterium]
MTRSFRIGYFVTAMAGGMRDGALGWNDLKTMARLSEEVGLDSFFVPDHMIFKPENEPPHAPWECWSLLSALAAVTERVQIGTLVVCVGFRNPALLAKMAVTVDEISDGRLILGLGAGWHEPEYEAFGFPFERRFDRFEEAAYVIRTLLREGRIDHDGEFYQLRDCELIPRGPRPDGPPILIGALQSGKRMLRMTAQFADQWNGWLLHGRSHPDELPPMREAVDTACLKTGRDPATLTRTIGILVDQRPLAEQGPVGASVPLGGTDEEIAAGIRAFVDGGISHIHLIPTVQGPGGIERIADLLPLLED